MQKTLVEPGRYDGNWWLPGAPASTKVPGTLVIHEDGGIELHLIGALSEALGEGDAEVAGDGSVTYKVTRKSLTESGAYPRILGEVGNSGYTLDDCFQTNLSGAFMGGLQTQRIHVHQALSRVHFDEAEALNFTAAVVRLYGIEYWINETGIGEGLNFVHDEDEHGEKKETVKVTENRLQARNLETKTVAGVDGSVVTIEHVYTIKGNRLSERGFSQYFNLRVKYPGPAPLRVLLEQISALQDLVTLAINRPAAFEQVTLRHAEVVNKMGGKLLPVQIGMAAKWTVEKDPDRPVQEHRILFTFEDLGGETVVSGWLREASKHKSALSRAMISRYSKSSYATDNLMNCAAALEAYDREKYRDEIHYVERIKRCIAHLGTPFEDFLGDADEWAKVLKNSRNDVAHHLAGIDGVSTKQTFVSQSAFWLFMLCLLKDAGASDALISKVLAHGDLTWLQEKLAAAMAP